MTTTPPSPPLLPCNFADLAASVYAAMGATLAGHGSFEQAIQAGGGIIERQVLLWIEGTHRR